MNHACSVAEPAKEKAGTLTLAREPLLLAMGLSLFAVLLTLALRRPFAIDETRYLTVAWEMWNSGDPILLHLNGAPYSHKPPMLFWLINLAWLVTGPAEWSARLVPALFYPASVLATYRLAKGIAGPVLAARAALVLASTVVFAAMATAVMFDAMLTTATIMTLLGLLHAARGRARLGWIMFAASLAFGLLAKGPVMLMHAVPAAVLAPLWAPARPRGWAGWYTSLILMVFLGALPTLAWAVAAAGAGGADFAAVLLWKQTAGRMVGAFAHRRPFWFYLPLLPALLLPWGCSHRMWCRSAWTGLWSERIWRLPVIVTLAGFIGFSLISSKQLHYLLPLLPAAALILARVISRAGGDDRPENGFAIATLLAGLALWGCAMLAPVFPDTLPPLSAKEGLLLMALSLAVWLLRNDVWRAAPALTASLLLAGLLETSAGGLPNFDIAPLAARLDGARPIAFVGGYEGELGFAGRLENPVEVLREGDAAGWLARHRDGQLVARYKGDPPRFDASLLWNQRYNKRWIGLWSAAGVDIGAGGDASIAGGR